MVNEYREEEEGRNPDEGRVAAFEDRIEYSGLRQEVIHRPGPPLQVGRQGVRVDTDDRGQRGQVPSAQSVDIGSQSFASQERPITSEPYLVKLR